MNCLQNSIGSDSNSLRNSSSLIINVVMQNKNNSISLRAPSSVLQNDFLPYSNRNCLQRLQVDYGVLSDVTVSVELMVVVGNHEEFFVRRQLVVETVLENWVAVGQKFPDGAVLGTVNQEVPILVPVEELVSCKNRSDRKSLRKCLGGVMNNFPVFAPRAD